MKNLLCLFLATIVLGTIFCGCKKFSCIDGEKTVSAVDTARQSRIDDKKASTISAADAAKQQRIEDSIAYVNFSTPDLKFFDLHGHVKKVEVNFDQELDCQMYVIIFDKKGVLKDFDNYYKLIRNSKGQISKMYFHSEDESAPPIIITYSYNQDGHIVQSKSECGSDNYIVTDYSNFNKQNWYTSTRETFADGYVRRTSYKYPKTDKMGNWTLQSDGIDKDTRKITYYTPEELK